MKDVQILIKPNNISYDSICEVIAKAHSTLDKDGVGKLTTTGITTEEIQEKLGNNGICFVAMDGDKIAGTASVAFVKCNGWFFKGDAATFVLLAVLPEYRRQGIAAKFEETRMNFVKQNGVEVIIGGTNSKNIASINLHTKNGFRLVSFHWNWANNQYIVRMAYWLNGCPYSKFYCSMRYNYSKIKTKLTVLGKRILKRTP